MAPTQLKLEVNLGEDFMNELTSVMDREFQVAAKKWGYNPTSKEKAAIRVHAINQLVRRVSSVSNTSWTPDPIVTFTMIGPQKTLKVPSKESTKASYRLVRSRDGWVLDQDDTEESVPINDFPQAFREAIFNWARTAIFYSVGSYKV